MGWTSAESWKKKADVVAAILAAYSPGEVIESRSTKSGLWLLVKGSDAPRIDFYLIERCSYKDMTEGMGPCYYDCPLDLLAKAPEVNADWRASVRAFHAAKGATFNPGDEVTVFGREYTVVGLAESRVRKYLVKNAKGKVYAAKPGDIRLTSEVKAEIAAEREAALAAPYTVTCAFGDWHESVPSGMVGVIATPGGNRKGYGEEKKVLVPADKYDARRGSYVLDGTEAAWLNAA